MEIIRNRVFETNSSSTHSITMCMKSDYDKWKDGKLYFWECASKFVTKEERDEILRKYILEGKLGVNFNEKTITYKDMTVHYEDYEDKYKKMELFYTKENLEEITQEEIEDFVKNYFDRYEMPCTYNEWYDSLDFETYCSEFTTQSNEVVIGFGFYGADY